MYRQQTTPTQNIYIRSNAPYPQITKNKQNVKTGKTGPLPDYERPLPHYFSAQEWGHPNHTLIWFQSRPRSSWSDTRPGTIVIQVKYGSCAHINCTGNGTPGEPYRCHQISRQKAVEYWARCGIKITIGWRCHSLETKTLPPDNTRPTTYGHSHVKTG